MIYLAVAAVCGGLLLLALWGRPRLALVVWLLSITMLPIWISVHFLIAIPVHCIVAVIAATATVFHTSLKGTLLDVYFGLFMAVCVLAMSSNAISAHSVLIIIIQWGIPFLAARVLVSATGIRYAVDAVALIFGLVGALAVLELLADWHPFVSWSLGSATGFQIWGPIQYRGGVVRSEWAFGHSIALGASLAMAIPFIVRSSFSGRVRGALLIAAGAGAFASASRIGIVATVLTAGICLVNAESMRRLRVLLVVSVGAGFLLAYEFLLPAVQRWAAGESRGDQLSAQYRGQLYADFLPRIEWLSPYDLYARGENAVTSMDSAVLDIGLRFGWLALGLAAFPFALAVFRTLMARASAAEIALVGQIPVLATVALITQYQNLLFVVAAIAVQQLSETQAMTAASEISNSQFREDDAPAPSLRPTSIGR